VLLAAFLLGGEAFATPVQRKGEEKAPPEVLVVPIQGPIDFRTVALMQRGLREARAEGIPRLILEIDTPGGAVTEMEEVVSMLRQMRESKIATLAYIRRQGLSAGAVIALACDRIFMGPGATLGACTPVFGGGIKGLLEDEFYAKLISGMRAEIRTIASRHGGKAAVLAEAMVDPGLELHEIRYRGKDRVLRRDLLSKEALDNLRDNEVEILEDRILEPRPLTLTGEEALRLDLVRGLVSSPEELYRELGVDPAEVRRLRRTWSEELAGFLYGVRFFLLLGGVLMAVMAFKMPGTGLPEALSVLCFLLFFGGSWLVGLAAWTEILLFFLGVGLILVEIFVIPGTVISGLVGLISIIAALFLSLQPFLAPEGAFEGEILNENLWALTWVLAGVFALGFLLSKLLPHLPLFRNLLLEKSTTADQVHRAATQEPAFAKLLGTEGVALTDLRPSGKIEIGGEPYDVVTTGAYLESGKRVRVVQVEGNRILVEAEEGRKTGPEAPVREEAGAVSIPWLLLMLLGGLLAMVAEVFFPSFGVLSIASGILIVSTVFLAFQHGTVTGFLFLVSVLISVPFLLLLAFKFLPSTGIGRKLILDGPTFDPNAEPVGEKGLEALVGGTGIALTPLRPSGTVKIGSRRVDAKTRGESLDPGTPVRILSVEMSQVVVARAAGGPDET